MQPDMNDIKREQKEELHMVSKHKQFSKQRIETITFGHTTNSTKTHSI